MRKASFVCGIAVLLLMALFLASCSTTVKPTGTLAQASPSHSTAPACTPQPTPTQTAWPMATLKPKKAPLTDDDYYAINKTYSLYWGSSVNGDGDCYGIINAYGEVVLPFKYFDIQELYLDIGTKDYPKSKKLFFAAEYSLIPGKDIIRGGVYTCSKRKQSNL